MNNKKRNFRDYKPNIQFNEDYEVAIVPSKQYKRVLNESKATIHVYLYLALIVNKNKDLGYVRCLRTKNIEKAIGMPLRTVQECMSTLFSKEFIVNVCRNKDRSMDIYMTGYDAVGKKDYIKLPGFVFTKEFLSYDKAEMLGFLSYYYSTYTHAIGSLQKLKNLNDKAENWELVKEIPCSRILNEDTLMKKIKRSSKKELKRVLNTINQSGCLDIVNMGESKLNCSKYIVNAGKTIRKLFKPTAQQSFFKTRKLALANVLDSVKNLSLNKYLNTKKHLEDLTQMFVEYGQAFFSTGLVALHNRIEMYGKPISEDGEVIDNICGYIRNAIENSITEFREDNSESNKSIIDRVAPLYN